MSIQVTYRRTRRLSMRIVKNGDVHVSAPIGMPKSEVERFIEEHRDWITEARKKTCGSLSTDPSLCDGCSVGCDYEFLLVT